jgi:hypothetical protein
MKMAKGKLDASKCRDFETRTLVCADKTIVLVTADNGGSFSGVVVFAEDQKRIGEFSNDWRRSQFGYFTGSVTLEN